MAVITLLLLSFSYIQLQNENVDQTTESNPSAETIAPSTEWGKRYVKEFEPLKNSPRVTEIERNDNEVTVSVANLGKTPLEYYSAGRDHIQLFQETNEGKGWRVGRWDWCGTGKQLYTIEPGDRAFLKVRFWDDNKRERMLGVFREKGTKRSAFIVLAVEQKQD